MSEKKTPTAKETKKDPVKHGNDKDMPKEIGGFENKAEPTRYGDWETNGRCSDF